MNTKRIKCILTGRCKFKSSDTESKCNDKEKTCTITETCCKCGKKYTAVFTYKQLGMAYKPPQEIIDNIKDTVEIVDIIKPIYNFKASE